MITVVPSAPDAGSAGPRERLLPVTRALLRWALIVGLTVLAFRQSLLSLVDGTRAGSLIGYVWLLVGALLVAGIAISRQQRTELPIHDRQTDVIVGGLGMLMALMVHGILLQRYSQYYLLLRIDLIALWFFVISSSILLFGLRPLARFAWVWTLPLFMLPHMLSQRLSTACFRAANGVEWQFNVGLLRCRFLRDSLYGRPSSRR